MNFKYDEKEMKQGAKFLLGFIVAFAVLFGIFLFVPLVWLEFAVALPVSFVLNLFGATNTIETAQEPVLILIDGFAGSVQISELCTGVLEVIVVWAAIIASFGITWRKRLIGIAGALVAGIVFNQLRILVTIWFVLSDSLGFADFVHGVLFKVVLFLVIAGYYALWFYWATRSELGKPKKGQ